MVESCCVPGCAGASAPGAPVPLCSSHVLVVSDFGAAHHGTEDALPGPCLVCGSRVGVRFASGMLCAVCEWPYGDVPDQDLAPPRVDVVYYLRQQDGVGDRIKIGTTANPRQRLARIAHQDLLAFERGDRMLERHRHAQFTASRYPGTEWFRVTPALLEHVAVVGAGVPDPWALHARWLSEALALRG
ncbi:T5orf172 domain-containing protein [Curtobacterium sp. PhB130]|uniref:GIY-YIG nuclease family protein n=1 Tax=unclassified Curtobacterium TaxID=257496 RepID=UPI000F4C2D41|nr:MULTISPECIES: GIY-YIG nuclease family protein [unclassified Curtobacterium]ROP65924.1 T5orf172 domain-containing protein [Curtobacterium sp. ZW137]ROS74027.1 T5orf172 domain-containing protein [Curtobacterium sp. PhB130]